MCSSLHRCSPTRLRPALALLDPTLQQATQNSAAAMLLSARQRARHRKDAARSRASSGCLLQGSQPSTARTLHRHRCGEVASRGAARVAGRQPEDPRTTLYPCRHTGSVLARNQAALRPGSGAHGAQRGEACRPQRRQRPRQVVTLDGPAVRARQRRQHGNMLQGNGSAGCATGKPYPTTHTRTGSWSWSRDAETKPRTIDRRT